MYLCGLTYRLVFLLHDTDDVTQPCLLLPVTTLQALHLVTQTHHQEQG